MAQVDHTSHRLLKRLDWRMVAGLVLVAALFYIVVPQLRSFKASFSTIEHAKIWWLGGALVAAAATYSAAAGVYCAIALKRLRYQRTLFVQVASTSVNRLVPGGIGALSINYDYLRRQKHSLTQAGSVVATNNVLGFIGNLLLLASLAPFTTLHIAPGAFHHRYLYWFFGVALFVIMAVLLWSRHLRTEAYRIVWGMLHNILRYRTHPLRLFTGLLLSISVTWFYTLCVAACAQALAIHLTVPQAFIIMTLGTALGTVTPTPGGLGGAEAGLFAGGLAYHLSSAHALDVALTYRLFTYWLALPVGVLALLVAERRHYV